VFAGADLAYSNGLQYCRNTVYEEKWRDFPTDAERAALFLHYLAERPHLLHPDVCGGEVVTTPHFLQFRDWIVSRAAEAADRSVANATGGGILRGGRITQIDFAALQLGSAAHALGLHRRLFAAWTSGVEKRRAALEGLISAMTVEDRLPMTEWLYFGGDTCTASQIKESLTSAAATRPLDARPAITAALTTATTPA